MTIQYKDYYQLLGVERDASDDEIKRAFRDLARKYHPDVSKEADADKRFKEINEAYEVLKDSEKRQRYDSLGSAWQNGQEFHAPPGWEQGAGFDFGGGHAQGEDFSDFFSSMFGEMFAGRSGGQGFAGGRGFGGGQPRAMRGQDAEAELTLSLVELADGSPKSIKMQSADGSTRDYEVKIPPGTIDGTRIRLSGQGHPGHGGGPSGDLFLRVRLQQDPRFVVDGSDLKYTLELSPWEAVLGAKVDVATLHGEVALNIAAGTQSGQTLRLRGQGLPRNKDQKGDLLVTVKVVIPTDPSDEERALFEQLAKESSFKPRG